MFDCFDGYQELTSHLDEHRREYSIGSPNWLRGRTLLVVTENLKQGIDFCAETAGDYTGTGQKLQFLMTRSAIHHLDASFIMVRNQLYNPPRSHLRFLFEMYLLLKGLNADWDRSARIYDKTRDQLREEFGSGWITGKKLATVNEFDDIVDEQRNGVKGTKEAELLWDHPSWSAVHPYSLEAIDLDLSYDENIEGNLLDMLNTFVFGISAQFVRTWEGTEFYWEILERMDLIFARVRLATGGVPPRMFDDDLKFWMPEAY